MQQDENMLLRSMYERYQAVLRTVARNNGIPYDDISDVVQETYISYYEHYPLDWPQERQKSMLVKILRHKCADYYRKNSHFSSSISVDDQDAFDETEILMKHLMQDSLECIVGDESYMEIRKCISEMKRDWRDVATLRFVEERSIEEICDVLGITGTVCRSRISRARKHLKKVLGPIYRN